AGGRPDRTLLHGVELARHQCRGEAGVCGEDFVGANHRESITQHDDDGRFDSGERLWKDQMRRAIHLGGSAVAVEPMNTKEIERVGDVRQQSRESMRYFGSEVRGCLELPESR